MSILSDLMCSCQDWYYLSGSINDIYVEVLNVEVWIHLTHKVELLSQSFDWKLMSDYVNYNQPDVVSNPEFVHYSSVVMLFNQSKSCDMLITWHVQVISIIGWSKIK